MGHIGSLVECKSNNIMKLTLALIFLLGLLLAWCNLNHRLWTLGAVIHGNIAPLSVVKPAEQPLILKTFWLPIVEFNAPNVNYAHEQQVLRGENAEKFCRNGRKACNDICVKG